MNLQKTHLLEIFNSAISRVKGDEAVYRYLQSHPSAQDRYVIAIGKAAQAMAEGAVKALGDQIRGGLIISKYGHTSPLPGFQIYESSHPVPDMNSLAAGKALLSFIASFKDGAEVLVLISGGASALVEVMEDGVDLQSIENINQQLLHQGKTIHEMNALRKQLSRIKGGKLARYLQGKRVTQLLISDVPGDDIQTIGSGLLVCPPENERMLALEVAEALHVVLPEPAHLPHEQDFTALQSHIIATNADAMKAAANKAGELGYPVIQDDGILDGDTYQCSRACVQQLQAGEAGIYLWGGETVLQLPENPGRGGRNQAFALQAAVAMAGNHQLYLMAAGTDGTDGPTQDCGALIDGETVMRARQQGIDVQQSLIDADSGTCLESSGDLIQTGPTGTNVMDLVLALKQ